MKFWELGEQNGPLRYWWIAEYPLQPYGGDHGHSTCACSWDSLRWQDRRSSSLASSKAGGFAILNHILLKGILLYYPYGSNVCAKPTRRVPAAGGIWLGNFRNHCTSWERLSMKGVALIKIQATMWVTRDGEFLSGNIILLSCLFLSEFCYVATEHLYSTASIWFYEGDNGSPRNTFFGLHFWIKSLQSDVCGQPLSAISVEPCGERAERGPSPIRVNYLLLIRRFAGSYVSRDSPSSNPDIDAWVMCYKWQWSRHWCLNYML